MTFGSSALVCFLVVAVAAGCGQRAPDPAEGDASPRPVTTGAEVLAEQGFELLRNQRVGLIANHTSRIGDEHLADVLSKAQGVHLEALFGPEHGIRGSADAGARIEDATDAALGVPIYSLYGSRRSPPSEVLDKLDVMVFDIQDVGARFYTYVSTMGLAMEAAAQAGLPFVVLDRPNPLGGEYVSGFIREPELKSFVGHWPIPIAHGMTVAELARMAVGERWTAGLDSLQLEVVPMAGWRRSMQWPDTGLPWIPTSPNIPEFEVALVYPGACFFEGTVASEGRGTALPFITIGAEWLDGEALAAELNEMDLPGLAFEPLQFTPRSIPGMSLRPKLMDVALSGVRYRILDRTVVRPLEAGIQLMAVVLAQYADGRAPVNFFRPAGFDRLAGTRRLREALLSGQDADSIASSWLEEVEAFNRGRGAYLLYE